MEKHYQTIDCVLAALVKVRCGDAEGALTELLAANDQRDFDEALVALDNRQQELFELDQKEDTDKDEPAPDEEPIDYKSQKELSRLRK